MGCKAACRCRDLFRMCRFARAVTEFGSTGLINFEVLQDVSALTQKTLLLTANGESHVFDPYWGCPLGAGPGSFHDSL